MKFYLVRHPETKRNAMNKLSGWEICEYSKLGEEQFDKILRYFLEINLPVYSSDLPRAKNLARELIKKSNNYLTIDK